MSRCLLIILVVAVFTGCGKGHVAEWPGLVARGVSKPGQETLYRVVEWEWSGGSDRPGFSIRLPDGTVLTPSQITIERTGASAMGESGTYRAFLRYTDRGSLNVGFGTASSAKQ